MAAPLLSPRTSSVFPDPDGRVPFLLDVPAGQSPGAYSPDFVSRPSNKENGRAFGSPQWSPAPCMTTRSSVACVRPARTLPPIKRLPRGSPSPPRPMRGATAPPRPRPRACCYAGIPGAGRRARPFPALMHGGRTEELLENCVGGWCINVCYPVCLVCEESPPGGTGPGLPHRPPLPSPAMHRDTGPRRGERRPG